MLNCDSLLAKFYFPSSLCAFLNYNKQTCCDMVRASRQRAHKAPALCHSCNELKPDTYHNLCLKCKENHAKEQTKRCSTCKLNKPWSQFSKSQGCLFDLDGRCKQCMNIYKHHYMKKKENFLKKMLSSCRTRNNLRNRNGLRALAFTLTYEQMIARLIKQKDKCYISDLQMNFEPHSNWQCSPERIDNTKGYTDSNVRFICLEFQLGNGLQASKEMVEFLCIIETKPHPRLTEIMSGKFIEGDYEVHCSEGRTKCVKCEATYKKHYNNTVRGRLNNLSLYAKHRTRTRNARGRGHDDSENDYNENLKMLQEQQGKCHLTGHHLSFESGKWNCVSLERINVNLTYNKTGNCCLIMQCINTTNHSSRISHAKLTKDHGNGAWTCEKIAFLRDSRLHCMFISEPSHSLNTQTIA